MPSVFLLLILIAGLLAILSMIPQTSSYPMLSIAVLLVIIALFAQNR